MYEEHSINRCGETMREDGSQSSKPKGYVYWSYKNCTKNQVKDAWKYHAGFSEETSCMGGHGSKPAFDILKGMTDVKIKRGYTIYKGHVAFDVYAKTKNGMRKALKQLHTIYHWIGEMHFVEHNPRGFTL